jgi:hypothetical protein
MRPDGAAILPRPGVPRIAVRWPTSEISSPIIASLALAAICTGCVVLVLFSTAEPTWLVPSSSYGFPSWVPDRSTASALGC